MSSTLLFAAPALRDLDALFDMIAEDSPARAARLIMRIRARCERLETVPLSGRARPEFGADLRSIPVWPVVVFYRVVGEFVIVARVIDGRRDLGTIDFE
jgi:toxin ParE1/3/4